MHGTIDDVCVYDITAGCACSLCFLVYKLFVPLSWPFPPRATYKTARVIHPLLTSRSNIVNKTGGKREASLPARNKEKPKNHSVQLT
jgi:hypothetical protein